MLEFRHMKNPWVIVGVITIVLFAGAMWYSNVSAERNNEGVVVQQHIKGNEAAAVTLVEYSDLQCPACAAFAPVVDEVINLYGENLSFEYKHFPLPIHRFAQQAAVAAEAASQQDAFFPYHDLLFENQSEWSQSANPQIFFLRYAEELGLDRDLFSRHQNASILRDRVRSDLDEARGLGLTGTPTFFLNGERMSFQTYEEFVLQIAAAVDPTSVTSDPTTEGGVDGAPNSGVRFGL